VRQHIATWNPARGVWETTELAFCGHSVPYSATWPASGMTRGGEAFELPTSAPHTPDSACSSSPNLPTPRVAASRTSRGAALAPDSRSSPSLAQAIEIAEGVLPREFESWDELPASWHGDSVRLLSTPAAADAKRGAETESGGTRPSGAKRSRDLVTDTALLPTPLARDGKGRAPTRRDGSQNLAGAVEDALIPTPTARDRKGAGGSDEGGPNLPTAMALLPTPDASVFNDGQSVEAYQARKEREIAKGYNGNGGGTPLAMAVKLLPTPRATDGPKGCPQQRGSSGDLMMTSAILSLLPTPTASDRFGAGAHGDGGADLRTTIAAQAAEAPEAEDDEEPSRWGPYAAAISRWETITGREAPPPTIVGQRGQPALAPRFVEWVMGVEPGHVTDVPNMSRNAALKLLGNGVVPAQAAMAVRGLLTTTTPEEAHHGGT
jgi:hypothetical protein